MGITITLSEGLAASLRAVPDAGVDLVVTSPPYPMIEMWDDCFAAQDATVAEALERQDGAAAFERMHRLLDAAWSEVHRVLRPGGLACINIGDATRTVGGEFRLFANHARVLGCLERLGFVILPDVLWRKPTNSPTKFLGSGMLPAGAYVTYEHEYVLIARKGSRRQFASEPERLRRRQSAFFWEERNAWFSDVWMDVRGTGQRLEGSARQRSAAFPFELPYRLVCMFSVRGDTVLDPFAGTGTTLVAAAATGRNAVGVDVDPELLNEARRQVEPVKELANAYNRQRLERHVAFMAERAARRGPARYVNRYYGFPVVTAQERDLLVDELDTVEACGPDSFSVRYVEPPHADLARAAS